jgi:hypothetical protein
MQGPTAPPLGSYQVEYPPTATLQGLPAAAKMNVDPRSITMTMRRFFLALAAVAMIPALLALVDRPVRAAAGGGAIKTEVVKSGSGWVLMRGGKPYLVKGVGGDASKPLLATSGGNSFRTWGVGGDTQGQLDEAQKDGLTVTLGIWLGQEGRGFNYNDAAAVARQLESVKGSISRFKDHPALLIWALGNEMEGSGDNPNMWKAIDDMAVAAKKIDPNHPTMTVVAELGGKKVQNFMKYCPNVDILGINSYAGGASAGQRYKANGGTKPFLITEYGPPGTWETGKNAWGASVEMTSTEKGECYRKTWVGNVEGQKDHCLGGYAFLWASKQEATATWFGMLLPDGNKLEAVDTMAELWGKPSKNRCPQIKSLKLQGGATVKAGDTVKATVDAADPEKDPLRYQWVLRRDAKTGNAGGASEPTQPTFPTAIATSTDHEVEVKMPTEAGSYRLFVYIYDGKGSAAVGNLLVRVQ